MNCRDLFINDGVDINFVFFNFKIIVLLIVFELYFKRNFLKFSGNFIFSFVLVCVIFLLVIVLLKVLGYFLNFWFIVFNNLIFILCFFFL